MGYLGNLVNQSVLWLPEQQVIMDDGSNKAKGEDTALSTIPAQQKVHVHMRTCAYMCMYKA